MRRSVESFAVSFLLGYTACQKFCLIDSSLASGDPASLRATQSRRIFVHGTPRHLEEALAIRSALLVTALCYEESVFVDSRNTESMGQEAGTGLEAWQNPPLDTVHAVNSHDLEGHNEP